MYEEGGYMKVAGETTGQGARPIKSRWGGPGRLLDLGVKAVFRMTFPRQDQYFQVGRNVYSLMQN